MFRRRGKSIDDAERADTRLTSLEDAVGNLQHRMATHEFRFRDFVSKQSSLESRLDRELQRRRMSDETSPPVASHRGAGAFAMPPLQQSAMFDFDDLETLERMPSSTNNSIVLPSLTGPPDSIVGLTPSASVALPAPQPALALHAHDPDPQPMPPRDLMRGDILDTLSNLDTDMRLVIPAVNDAKNNIDNLRQKQIKDHLAIERVVGRIETLLQTVNAFAAEHAQVWESI